MNNIKYFYYLSPVHNKINNVVQILDSVSNLESTVVILLKNRQLVADLKRFLSSKGIVSDAILTKEDFDNNELKNGIFIVVPETASYFDQKNVNYVVSPFVSTSYDEMKRKIAPFQKNTEVSLVEIIGKNDSSVLQSFYKFPEIVIVPFELSTQEKCREVRINRLVAAIENNSFGSGLQEITSDLSSLVDSLNLDILKKFLAHALFIEMPYLDFSYQMKKENKKVTIQLAQGSIDGVSTQKMKAYLLSLEGMSFENIVSVEIKENTSDIVVISKQFAKEDFVAYFEKNLFFDQKLTVVSIEEELVPEPKKELSEEEPRERRFSGRSNFGGGSGSRYSQDKPRFRDRRDDKEGFSSDRRRDSRGGGYGERRNSFDSENRESRPFFKRNDRPFEKRYERRDEGFKRDEGFVKKDYSKPFDGEKTFNNSFDNDSGFEKRERSSDFRDRSSDFRKKRSFGFGGGDSRPRRDGGGYGDKRSGGYSKPFGERKKFDGGGDFGGSSNYKKNDYGSKKKYDDEE